MRNVAILLLLAGCGAPAAEAGKPAALQDAGATDAGLVDASLDGMTNAVGHADAAADADAGGDAALATASGRHVCYIHDDCNGGRFNDYSSSACPEREPKLDSACALGPGNYCYYCDEGVDARHWWESIPEFTCDDGVWRVNHVQFACE